MDEKLNNGGPAFPLHPGVLPDWEGQNGMTLRDWFAGQALVGFVNAFVSSGWHSPNSYQIDVLVRNSFAAADAMLLARQSSKAEPHHPHTAEKVTQGGKE